MNQTKLTIQNFRGIKKAVLELATITLIAGINGAGKTSIVQALAALLAGEQLPSWCLKKNAGDMVNDNAKAGMIAIENEDYSASIIYPAVSAKARGRLPFVSMVAAGLESPLNMNDKDKAAYFSSLLKTDPTQEDLKTALGDMYPDRFRKLWGMIISQGWDKAHKEASEKGAEYKGAWMHIAGEKWGESKGATWMPNGANEFKLAGFDLEQAAIEMDNLNAERDAMIGSNAAQSAVAAAKTEQDLERIAELTEDLEAMPDLQTELSNLKSELSLINEKIKAYHIDKPEIVKADSQPCVWCCKPLSIKDGVIVKGGSVTKAEEDATARAYNNIMKQINDLETKKTDTSRKIINAENAIKVLEIKRNELATLQAKPEKETVEQEPVCTSQIDSRIAKLQAEIDASSLYQDALSYNDKIIRNKAIVDMLAPEGLRLTALQKGIAEFNAKIRASLGTVKLQEDLSFTWNERGYNTISTSEQYRVRAVVQIAIAGIENSEYLIFDGADVLDKSGRNGLMKAVRGAGIPALIAATMSNDGLPIGGIDWLRVYWVENGVVE